jgi:uncharacterized protein YwqG
MRDEDQLLYATLQTHLRAAGLGHVADKVLRLARPAIRLDLTRTEETAIAVGRSKVGGSADLPPGVEWPSWRGGPLPFIAQVRLEEVAALDPEGDLPHQGLLSFFYADDDPESGLAVVDDPTAWRVLYSEDVAQVEQRPLPDVLADGYRTSFSACAVACSRRLTLPDAEAAAMRALGLTNDEHRGYTDIVSGQSAGFETEMDHRLLGHPYTLEPDPFLAGYLARNGIERPTLPVDPAELERRQRAMAILQEAATEWRLPPPADDYRGPEDASRVIADLTARMDLAALQRAVAGLEPTPAPPDFLARMEELRRAAEEEWRLLLQLYNNEEAEMDWAGGGVLHFGIARADLAARDFNRVWVNVDFM